MIVTLTQFHLIDNHSTGTDLVFTEVRDGGQEVGNRADMHLPCRPSQSVYWPAGLSFRCRDWTLSVVSPLNVYLINYLDVWMRIRMLPPDSCISAQHTGLVLGSMVGTGALGVTIRHPTPLQPLLPQASKNYTTTGVTFPHGDRIPCQDCNFTQAKSQSLSRPAHKHEGKKNLSLTVCLFSSLACPYSEKKSN